MFYNVSGHWLRTEIIMLLDVTYLLVLLSFLHRSQQLRCNVGVHISMDGTPTRSVVDQQSCPHSPGQSCLTARAQMTINGIDATVRVSSCSFQCEAERSRGCDEVLSTITSPDETQSSTKYIITKCDVDCCDSFDFCNPMDSQIRRENSSRRCYSGTRHTSLRQGLIVDTTLPITCPINHPQFGKDVSCWRATMETTDAHENDVGQLVLTQCQPTFVCDTVDCSLLLSNLPLEERDKVTSCSMACCQGDLCNDATGSRVNSRLSLLFSLLLAHFYSRFIFL